MDTAPNDSVKKALEANANTSPGGTVNYGVAERSENGDVLAVNILCQRVPIGELVALAKSKWCSACSSTGHYVVTRAGEGRHGELCPCTIRRWIRRHRAELAIPHRHGDISPSGEVLAEGTAGPAMPAQSEAASEAGTMPPSPKPPRDPARERVDRLEEALARARTDLEDLESSDNASRIMPLEADVQMEAEVLRTQEEAEGRAVGTHAAWMLTLGNANENLNALEEALREVQRAIEQQKDRVARNGAAVKHASERVARCRADTDAAQKASDEAKITLAEALQRPPPLLRKALKHADQLARRLAAAKIRAGTS